MILLPTPYLFVPALIWAGASASPTVILTPAAAATAASCTVASASNTTALVLREYLVETVLIPGSNPTNATTVRGTFSIENPAAGGDVYRLQHMPVSTGGGTWGVCREPAEPGLSLPKQLLRCQYLIERYRKTIGFRFQWLCDGGGNKPVLFDVTAIGELPTEVCVAKDSSTSGGVTQSCAFSADVKEVQLEVANLSWEEVGTSDGTGAL